MRTMQKILLVGNLLLFVFVGVMAYKVYAVGAELKAEVREVKALLDRGITMGERAAKGYDLLHKLKQAKDPAK